jgi:hypothetical protein
MQFLNFFPVIDLLTEMNKEALPHEAYFKLQSTSILG